MRHLLTLNTHKGLYQSNRLMFGIASAPAIWQREIEKILQGIPGISVFLGDRLMFGIASAPAIWQREIEKILQGIPGISVFLGDIKITGPNTQEHLKRLEMVLQRLEKYNLSVNLEKSVFLADEIQYCGYTISKKGIHKVKEKIDAIENVAVPQNKSQVRAFVGLVNYYRRFLQKPQNKSQVRAFVGLVNYYRRFLQNASDILHPLNNLLQNNVPFRWTKECKRCFENVKKQMQTSNVLCHFDPKLPLILATDASQYGVGAVLSHRFPDGSERPIQFASQTLTKTQQKYAQIDKEAYSLISERPIQFASQTIDLIKPEIEKTREHILPKTNILAIGERVAVRDYQDEKWKFGYVKERLGLLHYVDKLDDGRE
ncbi:Reverse transcriptase (RNA-dependent DNA polymerase) [Popillia japonica]|uniref:Reverse transcriptase (RNA-dependent DNA polymerase) n=1 Tax=Popillia japonica TaxID=7064 RepID=A0AAW1IVE3_POPJA